jgi:hypothetical protein
MFNALVLNWNVVPGFPGFLYRNPLVGLTLNVTFSGAWHSGEGTGVGSVDDDGATEPLGSGGIDADSEGMGAGVEGVPKIGAVMIWADAVDERVMFCPPVNTERSGVIREKCPTTVTLTLLPIAGVHEGVQVSETSAGTMVTNEPEASFTARHITRLEVLLHGWPAWKESGLRPASIAPSRAEFVTVIPE